MKRLLGECQSGNYIGAMPKKSRKKSDKVTVIGYGSQGRAVALNFRDSGYEVSIGLPAKSKSLAKAKADRFKNVGLVGEVVKSADIICMAFPDYLHGRVFERDIKKNLNENATLLFLHGFSIHFGFVKPPKNCDVILIAPHAPGMMVREKYLQDKSLSAFYAVHQNHSGKALKKAMNLAAALGFKKQKLLETTFEIETLGDLFGEQAVLCGGLSMLIKNGFEVLVENGIPPKHAYLEVAFQLDQIIALIKKYGIEGMFERISVAAQLGSSETGPYLIGNSVKEKMSARFTEIKSGAFAQRLNGLSKEDLKALKSKLSKLSHPELEKAVKAFNK